MKFLLTISVCILAIAAFWMNTDRIQSDYDVALASTLVADHAESIEILIRFLLENKSSKLVKKWECLLRI